MTSSVNDVLSIASHELCRIMPYAIFGEDDTLYRLISAPRRYGKTYALCSTLAKQKDNQNITVWVSNATAEEQMKEMLSSVNCIDIPQIRSVDDFSPCCNLDHRRINIIDDPVYMSDHFVEYISSLDRFLFMGSPLATNSIPLATNSLQHPANGELKILSYTHSNQPWHIIQRKAPRSCL